MSFELCCCCCSGSLLLRGAVIGLRRSRAKKWARVCEREREAGRRRVFFFLSSSFESAKKKTRIRNQKGACLFDSLKHEEASSDSHETIKHARRHQ